MVIAGVSVDVETEASAVRRVLGALDQGLGGLMVTVNVDHLRRCRIDERYAGLVSRAEIVVADGMPLVWASRVRGRSLPERVAGANLVWSMCEAAAARGRRVFLLGGDPGTAEAAKGVLETRYPGIRVCGTQSPERGFENDAGVLERLEASVADSRPEIVLIALGSPKQEYLGERLLEVMPGAWFIGCGISFSFMSGHVRRAPAWMQRCGLEWLHRLAQEPRRLARRYLVEGIPFAASLLFGAFRERLGEAAGRE
ncbi:MAG: WecB/TagA/CpsF family glycosyltransferase, partial [Phycisphaeraceae bacterium]|nr:WecB/TagA/CpsF family glycosyltransferase [Phycisphaeraceae bacterium]